VGRAAAKAGAVAVSSAHRSTARRELIGLRLLTGMVARRRMQVVQRSCALEHAGLDLRHRRVHQPVADTVARLAHDQAQARTDGAQQGVEIIAIDLAVAGRQRPQGLRAVVLAELALDGFELAVRAVLGQQVTVAAARTVARRVVERFGTDVVTPWPQTARAFPAPTALAGAPIESLAELGIIRSRAAAIIALAREWRVLSQRLDEPSRPDELIEHLCSLSGIGPWTAHYIAMRALVWPDAFPPNDVALLKAMKQHYGSASQREAETISQAWRPWRAYALLRLWNSLEKPS